jgi:hypothetical protein
VVTVAEADVRVLVEDDPALATCGDPADVVHSG